MPENFRALIVVLALSVVAFYIGRKLSASVIPAREFETWRNAWLASTIVAFLSNSFWIYAFFIVVLNVYTFTARKSNLGTYFFLLFSVPVITVSIGGFGVVNRLFDITNPRLLSMVLLAPILLSATRNPLSRLKHPYRLPDNLVCGYAFLVTVLQFRDSDITNVMRVGYVQILDILLPYFAFSRLITDIESFRKVMFALVLAVLPISLMAAFETFKSWRLYSTIGYAWSPDNNFGGYLQRDGILRGAVTANNPIPTGYIIMVGLGSFLGIQSYFRSKAIRALVLAILLTGIIAPFSRGPWVGAGAMICTIIAMGRNAFKTLLKYGAIGAISVFSLLLTPLGARILEFLPFFGSVDASNVDYRQSLIDNSLIVIERNIFFGDPNFLSTPEMLSLSTGNGFVDIVNSYVGIALNSGVVGVILFVGAFISVLAGLWQSRALKVDNNPEINLFIRMSFGILIGVLVTIGTVSSIDFVPYVYWSFLGASVALVRIARNGAIQSGHQIEKSVREKTQPSTRRFIG